MGIKENRLSSCVRDSPGKLLWRPEVVLLSGLPGNLQHLPIRTDGVSLEVLLAVLLLLLRY